MAEKKPRNRADLIRLGFTKTERSVSSRYGRQDIWMRDTTRANYNHLTDRVTKVYEVPEPK